MAGEYMPDIGQPVYISEMGPIFNQSGIYFLLDRGLVVYVGQSRYMTARIIDHITEKTKRFDAVSCKPCERRFLNRNERRYIELILPHHNRCNFASYLRRAWQGNTGIRVAFMSPSRRPRARHRNASRRSD